MSVPPPEGRSVMVGRLLAALAAVLVLAGCGGWPHPAPTPTKPPVPTTSVTSTTTRPPTTTTVPPTTTSSTATSTTPPVTTTTQPPRVGCLPVPSACGYPDATNTGYKPTGATLTTAGIVLNSDGDYVVTTPGAVIDGKDIRGCVMVHAPNVTIKRSKITCTSLFNIRLFEGSGNFTLEDVEVDGSGAANNAAFVDDGSGPVTVRRMDMHHVADGPHPGEHWLIEDSYIHDLTRCDVCHNDTIQSLGAVDVTVRHNTLVNLAGTTKDGGMNAVVRIATEQGPVTGFVVENNLMAGGNYFVQVRSQGNGAPTGVKILNNRVARGKTPDNQPYPRFGAWDYPEVTVQLSGNVWDDNGTTVN